MLTKKEVAARWHISERTLNRWIKKRPIPYQHVGNLRKVMFKEEDIVKWEKILGIGRSV